MRDAWIASQEAQNKYNEAIGANAFASTAAIPIVGPELAPAVAAASYAGALSFAAVSAERGAVLPNANTIGFLHPNEMVLPAGISKGLQGMIANGGAGGRGHTFNQNVSYRANAPTMSKTELMKFTRRSGKALLGIAKNRALGI